MSVIPMRKPGDGQLRNVELSRLQPHPQNPRRIERRDVIERIRQQLEKTGEFDPAHALLVRPLTKTSYQIISGHHRAIAAREAGFDEVPAWVRNLNDEEAFLELALGNAQGELTALEKGEHARLAVVSGMTVRDYAAKVGEKEQSVFTQLHAAEIAVMCAHNFDTLRGYTQHLSLIHSAPEETWKSWVDRMLENKWTVEELRDELKRHKPMKTVPEREFVRLVDWQKMTDADRHQALNAPCRSHFNAQDSTSIEWARWSWNPRAGETQAQALDISHPSNYLRSALPLALCQQPSFRQKECMRRVMLLALLALALPTGRVGR